MSEMSRSFAQTRCTGPRQYLDLLATRHVGRNVFELTGQSAAAVRTSATVLFFVDRPTRPGAGDVATRRARSAAAHPLAVQYCIEILSLFLFLDQCHGDSRCRTLTAVVQVLPPAIVGSGATCQCRRLQLQHGGKQKHCPNRGTSAYEFCTLLVLDDGYPTLYYAVSCSVLGCTRATVSLPVGWYTGTTV